MTMMPQAPEAPPEAPPEAQGMPIISANPEEVLNALLLAVQRAAEFGAGSEHMEDMGDCSKAALAYAQAWAILHPQLDPAGLPLDHHLQMENLRGQNAVALEQARGANQLAVAKEAARAPTPVKSIKVQRDSAGRASSYEQS